MLTKNKAYSFELRRYKDTLTHPNCPTTLTQHSNSSQQNIGDQEVFLGTGHQHNRTREAREEKYFPQLEEMQKNEKLSPTSFSQSKGLELITLTFITGLMHHFPDGFDIFLSVSGRF